MRLFDLEIAVPPYFWQLVEALGDSVVFFLSVFAVQRFHTFLRKKLTIWRRTKMKALSWHTVEIIPKPLVYRGLAGLLSLGRWFVVLNFLAIYLLIIFRIFPGTLEFSVALGSALSKPFVQVGLAILAYLPNLLSIAIIIVLTTLILRAVRYFFSQIERGAVRFRNFHSDWADPTYRWVKFLLLVISGAMIFPYLPGSDSAAFRGMSVFLGVLVSFGSSSIVSSVMAGVGLTYMRPFKVGDRVKINETIGDVTAKTLLATRIRTIKNVEVVIPNSIVMGHPIVNYSSMPDGAKLILHTSVSIGYSARWETVHELLIAAALKTKWIETSPAPFVLQTQLGDFYITYEINAFTSSPSEMISIYSELHQNIQDEFNRAGVEIMSPHFVAVRDGNTEARPDESLKRHSGSPNAFKFVSAEGRKFPPASA
jgi:small-conductance mechanosensitive channel